MLNSPTAWNCFEAKRFTRRVKGRDHLLAMGAEMGITAMIPDMTIGQLMNEASARWGEIWDPHAARMTLLMLCPRKERKMMELHGDMIEHGQPVISVFHRPRAEAHLLKEQGFDPRSASFMFVNIATADMGPWMQQLINNEGWLRNAIQLASRTPRGGGNATRSAEGAVADATPTRRLRRAPNQPAVSRGRLAGAAGIFGQSGLPIRLAKVRPLRAPRRADCRK